MSNDTLGPARPVALRFPALDRWALQLRVHTTVLSPGIVQVRGDGRAVHLQLEPAGLVLVDGPMGAGSPLRDDRLVDATCLGDTAGPPALLELQDGWVRARVDNLPQVLDGLGSGRRRSPPVGAGPAQRFGHPALLCAEGLLVPVSAALLMPTGRAASEQAHGVLPLALRFHHGAWQWRILAAPPRSSAQAFVDQPWLSLQARLDAMSNGLGARIPRVRQLRPGAVEGRWVPGPPALVRESPGRLLFALSGARVLVAGGSSDTQAPTQVEELLDDVPLQPDSLELELGDDAVRVRFGEGPAFLASEAGLRLGWTGQEAPEAHYDLRLVAVPPGDRPPPTGPARMWLRLVDGWLGLQGGARDDGRRFGWGRSQVVTETRAVRLLPWLRGDGGGAALGGSVELLLDNSAAGALVATFTRGNDGELSVKRVDLAFDRPGLRTSAGRHATAGHDQSDPGLPPLDTATGVGPRAVDLVLLSPHLVGRRRDSDPLLAMRLTPDDTGAGRMCWMVQPAPGLQLCWWRRLSALPLVAPVGLAANDPRAQRGISPLRGLVPISCDVGQGLELTQATVGAPFQVTSDPAGRLALAAAHLGAEPLLAPLPEHLGVELSCLLHDTPDDAPPWQVRATVRTRYAVPFLDAHYRSADLVGGEGPVATALTWVQGRHARNTADPRSGDPTVLVLNPGDGAAAEGDTPGRTIADFMSGLAQLRAIDWAPRVLDPLPARVEEREIPAAGLRLFLEWEAPKDGGGPRRLRRWSVARMDQRTAPTLFGLAVEARRLEVESAEGGEDRFRLELLLGEGDGRSRLGLRLAGAGGGALRVLPGDAGLVDASGQELPGRLVLPADTLLRLLGLDAPARAEGPWWVSSAELTVLETDQGALGLRAEQLAVWVDDGQVIRLRTDHGLLLTQDDAHLDPLGPPDKPVLVRVGNALRAVRRIRSNGLLIEARYRGFSMVADATGEAGRLAVAVQTTGEPAWLAGLESQTSGSRVVLSWAGRHAVSGGAEPYGPGLRVTGLNRLYLELRRQGDGGLSVAGAFVGWTAGDLFGLSPDPLLAADGILPHLTFVQPVLDEGDADDGDADDGGASPRGSIELNGAWRTERSGPDGQGGAYLHDLTLICWDSRIDMVRPSTGADTGGRSDDALVPAGSVSLLLRHELRRHGSQDGGDLSGVTSWFAWQTAGLGADDDGGRQLDLSAVFALLPWHGGPEALASAASHRPGTMLVRARLDRDAITGRLDDDEQVVLVGLPLRLRAGGAPDAAPRLQPAAGWQALGLDPPLAPYRPDASGAGASEPWYSPRQARRWRAHPGLSTGFVVGRLGGGSSVLDQRSANALAFTLFEDGSPSLSEEASRARWLACEVVALDARASDSRGPDASDRPAASPPPRIRVFGADGMRTLHAFPERPGDGGTVSEAALVQQTRAVLTWAGWRRLAVLELPGPRWRLVASPLPDWTAPASGAPALDDVVALGGADPERIDPAESELRPLRLVPVSFDDRPAPPRIQALELSRPPDAASGRYAPEALNQWRPAYVRALARLSDGVDGLATLPAPTDRVTLSVDRRAPFLVDRAGTDDLGLPSWLPGRPEAMEQPNSWAYLASSTRLELCSPRPGEQVTWGLAATAVRLDDGTPTRLASEELVFTVRTPRAPDDQEQVQAVATPGAAADGLRAWQVAWTRSHPERYPTDDPDRTVILAVHAPGDPRVLAGGRVRIWWWVKGHPQGMGAPGPDTRTLFLRVEGPRNSGLALTAGIEGERPLESGGGLDIPLMTADKAGRPLDAPASGLVELQLRLADAAAPPEDDSRWQLSMALSKVGQPEIIEADPDWTDAVVTLDPAFTVAPPDARLLTPPPSFLTLSQASSSGEQVQAHGSAPSTGWVAVEVAADHAVRWQLQGSLDLLADDGAAADAWRVSVIGPDGSSAQARARAEPG